MIWPNCKIEGCPYKCCLALNSPFCFSHTPGNKYVKSIKIDVANVVELEPTLRRKEDQHDRTD